jgi:hypothetical protein
VAPPAPCRSDAGVSRTEVGAVGQGNRGSGGEPGRSSRKHHDDPELRYTQSGAALAGFTVAVSHRSKHKRRVARRHRRVLSLHGMAFGRREREPHASQGHAGLRRRQARPAHVAGRRRQQAADRRDPGQPRRTGSSVRARRRHEVDRRGFGFILGRSFSCVLGRGEAKRITDRC